MCNRKHGFSLVELLVVIVIIGMLVAMLLPAINYAREMAKQATCTNNQQQIAKAITNYESQKQQLPGCISRPLWTTKDLVSWPMALFPYIGRKDITDAAWQNKNWSLSNVAVNEFVCPDDFLGKEAFAKAKSTAGAGLADSGTGVPAYRVLSYVVILDLFRDRSNANSLPSAQSSSQIANPAQTIMMGERTAVDTTHAGPWGLWQTSGATNARDRLTYTWSTAGKMSDTFPSKHPGVSIVTFCDGHTDKVAELTLTSTFQTPTPNP